MAEVVELFGAPGTGKSSLVGALDGRRVAGRRIVAAERLLRVARRGPSGAVVPGAGTGAGHIRRLVERLVRRDRTTAELRGLVTARRTDWAPLLDLLDDAPLGRRTGRGMGPGPGPGTGREGTDPLAALRAPGWLLATLEARALADAAADDLVVVLGEGFVQRARLVCGDLPDAADMDRFVAAVPPAALQVHLTADPSVLVARLQARGRTIDRHAELDASGLAASVERDALLLTQLAARLDARGDAVLALETTAVRTQRSAESVIEHLATALR